MFIRLFHSADWIFSMRCCNQFKAYRSRFPQREVCFYGCAHDTIANNFAINNLEIYCWT